MSELQRWEKPAQMAPVTLNSDQRDVLSGPIRDVIAFQKAMQTFQQAGITVLSPPMAAIPPGHAIAPSLVMIGDDDVYPVPGNKEKVCLGKTALNRVAAAAGVRWDPVLTRRLDDGSNPHYCHYRAVGVVTDVDGQERIFSEEKEVDLRDGSAQMAIIVRSGIKKNQRNYAPKIVNYNADIVLIEPDYSDRVAIRAWRHAIAAYNAAYWQVPKNQRTGLWSLTDPLDQVDEIRAHILSHASTKAKNRALRMGLGVPIAGTAKNMQAFLVCRSIFTGQFGDAAIDASVAQQITAAALGAKHRLYGAIAGPPAPEPVQERHAPPAVEDTEITSHYVDDSRDDWDGPREPARDESPEETFGRLDIEGKRVAISNLALAKGKLGPDKGQVDHETLKEWDEKMLAAAYTRLHELPDAKTWTPPATEEIPF